MEIPEAVRNAWFHDLPLIHSHQIAGGLSNSRVWRLESSNQVFCLKAWPRSQVNAERLKQIHMHLQLLSDARIEFTPRLVQNTWGNYLLEEKDWCWDLTTWLSGEADDSDLVSAVRINSAIKAIGKMHAVWRGHEVRRAVSPGWNDRLQRLRKVCSIQEQLGAFSKMPNPRSLYRNRLSDFEDSDFDDRVTLTELSSRTVGHLKQSAGRLIDKLENNNEQQDLHFVVRDLHSEHVLYVGDSVTGIVDFGAARIDEPLLDVVRLLGSQAAFDRRARYSALEVYFELYQEIGQFNSARAKEALFWRYAILDEVSTLLSCVQWLEWLIFERRTFPVSIKSLLKRWSKLLKRLDLGEW